MVDNRKALKKAAEIARINISPEEEMQLLSEIDEALHVFSKIDEFKEERALERASQHRKMRSDAVGSSIRDPFSNSKLVKSKKFIGPKLV